MPTRFAVAVCAFAVAIGLFVLFGLALPTFRNGSAMLGALALVCAVLATALGLVGALRQSRRRP